MACVAAGFSWQIHAAALRTIQTFIEKLQAASSASLPQNQVVHLTHLVPGGHEQPFALQRLSSASCTCNLISCLCQARVRCALMYTLGEAKSSPTGLCITAGVVRAAQDVKIAQLQTSALDTIALMLKATAGGQALPANQQAAVQQQVNAMIVDNRSSAIKAHAADVLALFKASPVGDADMQDAH